MTQINSFNECKKFSASRVFNENIKEKKIINDTDNSILASKREVNKVIIDNITVSSATVNSAAPELKKNQAENTMGYGLMIVLLQYCLREMATNEVLRGSDAMVMSEKSVRIQATAIRQEGNKHFQASLTGAIVNMSLVGTSTFMGSRNAKKQHDAEIKNLDPKKGSTALPSKDAVENKANIESQYLKDLNKMHKGNDKINGENNKITTALNKDIKRLKVERDSLANNVRNPDDKIKVKEKKLEIENKKIELNNHEKQRMDALDEQSADVLSLEADRNRKLQQAGSEPDIASELQKNGSNELDKLNSDKDHIYSHMKYQALNSVAGSISQAFTSGMEIRASDEKATGIIKGMEGNVNNKTSDNAQERTSVLKKLVNEMIDTLNAIQRDRMNSMAAIAGNIRSA